jgi:hypothetical protein
VLLLHDERTPLAQPVEFAFYASEDHPDQGAEDEDAPRGDREHGEQKRPAPLVPAHAARVDGTHQAEPQDLQEAESASTGLGRNAGCVDDQGTREDQRREQDEKPADQGNGAPGDRVVESVAQPVGERDLSHTSFRAVIPNVQERMLQPLYRPQKLKEMRLKS